MAKGYIYIMTNPALTNMVKIGYATDVEERRKQLSGTALPYDYEVYATYETAGNLEDKKLHSLIDLLNPKLRVSKHREFYIMTPEDAFAMLTAIARISNTAEPKFWTQNKPQHIQDVDGDGSNKGNNLAEEEWLAEKTPEMVNWYRMLKRDIFDKVSGTSLRVTPNYILWLANGIGFCEFHLQKNKIQMYTLPPIDDHELGDLLPDSYNWTMKYRLYMNSLDDKEKVKEVLMDSYKQRNPNWKE